MTIEWQKLVHFLVHETMAHVCVCARAREMDLFFFPVQPQHSELVGLWTHGQGDQEIVCVEGIRIQG